MVRNTLDAAAATTTVGILANWITPFAGLFTLIWTAARLYEMWTGLPFHQTPLVKWIKREKNVDV